MQAMFVVKLVTVLLAAAALANVVCERTRGANLVELSRHFGGKAVTWMHSGHLRGQKFPMAPPPFIGSGDGLEDEEEHRREWGIDERNLTMAIFNRSMLEKMSAVRECHKACGMEVACHDRCPRPWAHFAHKCQEVAPHMACHEKCKNADDPYACLTACPAVHRREFVGEMKAAMECHGMCGRFDHQCHRSCPKPMERLRAKCGQLREIHECHEACRTGDSNCHHQCPKFARVWQHPPLKVRDAAEAEEHRRAWGVEGTINQNATMAFHRIMHEKMASVRVCHEACGHDIACHSKCPKPWAFLAEKCHKAEPTIACHKSCRNYVDHHACRAQCPMPQCPELASKFKSAMECHQKCNPHIHQCHQSCPKPMEKLRERCGKLHETLGCHAGCNSDDLGCHHRCPKFMKLWLHSHKDKQEAGEAEQHHRDWGFVDNATDNGTIFHHIMRERMGGVRGCHVACGGEGACHERCPKPWTTFATECQKVSPAIACHDKCQHEADRIACHMRCPMPDAAGLSLELKSAMDCHRECGSDHRCHHSCPKPFVNFTAKCARLQGITACHKQCSPGDIGCHHQCPKFMGLWQHPPVVVEEAEWGFDSSHHEHERMAAFEDVMKAKMRAVSDCHKPCGKDGDCHAKCPRPWAPFLERCQGAAPIVACHQKCNHATDEHACRSQCSMPQCPVLVRRMEHAMECHSKCNRFDHQCHHSCPKPMQQLMQRCGELHQTLACHEECSLGDTHCHKQCPKFMRLWQRKAASGAFEGQTVGPRPLLQLQ